MDHPQDRAGRPSRVHVVGEHQDLVESGDQIQCAPCRIPRARFRSPDRCRLKRTMDTRWIATSGRLRQKAIHFPSGETTASPSQYSTGARDELVQVAAVCIHDEQLAASGIAEARIVGGLVEEDPAAIGRIRRRRERQVHGRRRRRRDDRPDVLAVEIHREQAPLAVRRGRGRAAPDRRAAGTGRRSSRRPSRSSWRRRYRPRRPGRAWRCGRWWSRSRRRAHRRRGSGPVDRRPASIRPNAGCRAVRA